MTTAIAKVETVSQAELDLISGVPTRPPIPRYARINVNRDHEDDNGNPLPAGTFVVDTADDQKIYAKTIMFQPLINRYQYILYDGEQEKLVSRSILFQDFGEEIRDTSGGYKCGKVGKKELSSLTPGQIEQQKSIKCKRMLYGLVSMTGKTADGTDVTISNVPALWKSGGANFMPVGRVLESLIAKGFRYYSFIWNLGLTKQKKGSNVFYTVDVSYDSTAPQTLTQDHFECMKVFDSIINDHNKDVNERFKDAKKPAAARSASKTDNKIVDTLEDDLNDPLPDSLKGKG